MLEIHALAEFVAESKTGDVPESVRAHCGTLTADSVGCTIGVLGTAEARAMIRALLRLGRPSDGHHVMYRLYQTGDVLTGAHLDAMLGNLLDFDDVYEGSGHVGCMIIPPALRLGVIAGAGRDDVVAAIVAGFEVSARILEASRPGDAARAEIWGIGSRLAVASAAVASRVLRLDPSATAHALALACATAPVASVRKTVYGESGVTWVKNNFGIAATAGVAAALMASEGARGPLDILDGPQGFARMIGTDRWIPDLLTEGLGERWMMPGIGLKPYPCCRHAHGVIDAAQQCLRELGVPAEAVDEIAVAGPIWIHGAPFTNPAPETMHDAQYSILYCVAVALLGIEPGAAWFERETLTRSDVRALAARVRVEPKPGDGSGGRVRMTAGGRATAAAVSAPRGSPRAPLSEAAQRAKYLSLVRGAMKDEIAARTFGDLKALRFEPDPSTFVSRLPEVDVQPVSAATTVVS